MIDGYIEKINKSGTITQFWCYIKNKLQLMLFALTWKENKFMNFSLTCYKHLLTDINLEGPVRKTPGQRPCERPQSDDWSHRQLRVYESCMGFFGCMKQKVVTEMIYNSKCLKKAVSISIDSEFCMRNWGLTLLWYYASYWCQQRVEFWTGCDV